MEKPYQITQQEFVLMQKWISRYDSVMLLLCSNSPDKSELVLLKQMRAKTTTWTSLNAAFFKELMKNTFVNWRSLVLLPRIFEREVGCLRGRENGTLPLNLADWVVLRDDSQLVRPVTYRGVQAVCALSSDFAYLEALNRSASKPRVHSRKCISKKIPQKSGWTAAFDGHEVILGCVPLQSVRTNDPITCNSGTYDGVFDVLRTLNATLKFVFFEHFASSVNALFEGDVDIIIASIITSEESFKVFFYPEVVEYRYERFYAWKGEATVSFVTFFLHSWPAVLSVLIVMAAAYITFNISECLERRRRGRFRFHCDWAMFLIASVFATPAPLPWQSVGNNRGANKRSQKVMALAWLFGVLPLSVYFSGELTSSLAVTIPPDPIDTVDELEAALDQGKLYPCIFRDNGQGLFLNNRGQSNNHNLRMKLRAAFERQSGTVELSFAYFTDCLNSCAKRPGFACFLYALDECFFKTEIRPYAESRDDLGLALISTPVRKDFILAGQFSKVTRRVFETALDPYAFNRPRRCAKNGSILLPSEKINVGATEILTLDNIHAFLLLFLVLLLLCVCVLSIEIVASSKWWAH
ncbi:hypothetical protein HPB48_019968 [Haemaphysalis longicornis]|uniref:Ionotropic receptor n=1 Tax=Haemaphysalis longicornis TaxID=44386 RepID=A0A9J6GDC8_HAELO|nr:hypothetical protein HPB48_019968 [Haemaphysalis longicornis]